MSDTVRTLDQNVRKTNYILANEVYIYPSAQSDDGGDVNTEQNVRGISEHLIYKSFVVRKEKDIGSSPAPLEVRKKEISTGVYSDTVVTVYKGEAVVEGYFINIKDDLDIDVKGSLTQEDFNLYSSSAYILAYDNYTGVNPPSSETVTYIDNNSMYLVIELLTNNTGNIRGDFTKRLSDGIERVNHGVSLRFYKGTELSSIGGDHLVLAQIIPKKMTSSSPDNFEIYTIINHASRYSYIHVDSIVTDDGLTLEEWILNIIKTISNKDRILKFNDISKRLYTDAVVSEENLVFTKYRPSSDPPQYDSEGQMIVIPYGVDDIDPSTYGYEKSYNINRIHRRTHIASSSDLSYYSPSRTPGDHTDDADDEFYNSLVSCLVDSRDHTTIVGGDTLGDGHHEMYPETYIVSNEGVDEERHPVVNVSIINNNNGTSRLLARADHNHGLRYIFSNYSITDDDYTQIIGTRLRNHHLTICDDSSISNDDKVILTPGRVYAGTDITSPIICVSSNYNGEDNSAYGSSIIVAGSSNLVDSHTTSTIVSGDTNTVHNTYCGMVFGDLNIIESGHNYLILGNNNKIDIGSDIESTESPFAIIGRNNLLENPVGISLFVGEGLTPVCGELSGGEQIILGKYNDRNVFTSDNPSISGSYDEGCFVIGEGSDSSSRLNVFSVNKNGDVYSRRSIFNENYIMTRQGLYINNDPSKYPELYDSDDDDISEYLIIGGGRSYRHDTSDWFNNLNNTVYKGQDFIILGDGNTVGNRDVVDNLKPKDVVIVGYNNTVSTGGYNLVVGSNNYIANSAIPTIVLGNYNQLGSIDHPGNYGASMFVGDSLKSVASSSNDYQVVIGQYNSSSVYGSYGRLVIGNGSDSSNTLNVFSVNKNGDTYIGGRLNIDNSYIIINGIRVYVSDTAPTGSIPAGSIGIGW